MFAMFWNLSATVHGYMRFYMPTNRAVDWLGTPSGLKWAVPTALVATPAYLFAMSICATITARGGPGYLNLLVLLSAWNAIKFAALGLLTPLRIVGLWLSRAVPGDDVVTERPRLPGEPTDPKNRVRPYQGSRELRL